jgi:exopolyphosphatase / guanosine-5'-triphosphate,3'-diphosphate pyrophosphatase
MRIAIIDCGTNTFNLLIAQLKDQSFNIIYSHKTPVKLGEGGIEKKIITSQAFERGIEALVEFKKIYQEYECEKVLCYATSAIRNAVNGVDFANEVKTKLNIDITIVDGNREAELIYKGVKLGVALNDSKSLIMDIGGGSTEFIIANKNQIFWKQSFEVGAARLLEIFKPSNPIESLELFNIINHLKVELNPLYQAINEFEVAELIGSSGSFDTFAEVISIKKNQTIDFSKITEYTFDIEAFKSEYDFILASNLNQRLKTPGIIPIRAEMIVVAAILINFILETIKINNMRLSTFSLKEGVLSELLQ